MSKKRIEESVYRNAAVLLEQKGYISPVELLLKMDRLKSKEVEDWRFKRIPYLERVIVGNLGRLNHILQTLKRFSVEQNLKPSITVYKSWGKGPKKLLRFSKTGNPQLEKIYSTHYVRKKSKKDE
ncbi:hypothetical protein JSQ81_11405 [Sporosarcina sp. Marseille-Q4063]|uniref:hypothetical protein n=1 Tax=Sporosarcina sp. Marseille-Q4063 TaxID=2810514 RepID=UPI001BAF24C9|nr:hypothetical protein [Sporosarcina sp. Marseille-Q4063]QUW20468.1 hypothetical protein JSQ81_11405 [Sporosarcina sp. Marseille-Q4063]